LVLEGTTEKTRVVVLYVSEPGAPFLDQISPDRTGTFNESGPLNDIP
jgi:hypothetical protein